MKSLILTIILIICLGIISKAQRPDTDSLKQLLPSLPPDTNRVKVLMSISSAYYFTNRDSCLAYATPALSLARQLNFKRLTVEALNIIGESHRLVGNFPESLKKQFEALEISRELKNKVLEYISLTFIGITYSDLKEYRVALGYMLNAENIKEEALHNLADIFNLTNIGNAYSSLGKFDSGLIYQKNAYNRMKQIVHPPLMTRILILTGDAFNGMGKPDSALSYYHSALTFSTRANEKINNTKVLIQLSHYHQNADHRDSALYYARRGYELAIIRGRRSDILESADLLVNIYRQAGKYDSSLFYADIVSGMKDSLYGQKRFNEIQMLMLGEQEKQQRIIQDQERLKNKITNTILASALGILLLVGFMLLRNNRQKQRAKVKIEQAYAELKDTQTQLIQREKMASLGELTAGIAHEIQNPLNFVNNFSEVNTELIAELNDELVNGNLDEAKILASHITENEKKINFHGKRADAIVKGMLQHSRSSTGIQEPTDINALADEYLRLAYHGLRAKDKSFNATMKTDLDPSVGLVNIIPQEIGRVILNLITNAFYAVADKNREEPQGYDPTVIVITKRMSDKIEICVKDNGNGIPANLVDKIFQPFFTTKPTGQGTGLGLSLSYDIIKAHGGEIKVVTKENEGSEFSIQLPTNV